MIRFGCIAIGVFCGFVLLLGGCTRSTSNPTTAKGHPGWPDELIIGYFAGNDTDETQSQKKKVREFLAERLGISITTITTTNYSAAIEAMKAQRIHAIAIGPFSYVLAVEEAHAEALAASVYTLEEPAQYDPNRKPYYYSVIFTRKGSGIQTLEDLKDKDFNFVDPASTSGHLFPKAHLIKHGIDPDTDMNTVFAGGHVSSVLSVWNGKSDAGATLETNLFRLQEAGQIDFCGYPDGDYGIRRTQEEIDAVYEQCPEGNLVILSQTDPIPRTPWAIRQDLPASLKQACKEALLDIKNHPELVEEASRWYVDPSKELGLETLDQFYNPVRDVAKILDLDLHELD